MGARIEEAVAQAGPGHGWRKVTARRLADTAARTCLARAGKEASDVDMLINAGVYREDSMGEPALATLIQEDIGAIQGPSGTAPSHSTPPTASPACSTPSTCRQVCCGPASSSRA